MCQKFAFDDRETARDRLCRTTKKMDGIDLDITEEIVSIMQHVARVFAEYDVWRYIEIATCGRPYSPLQFYDEYEYEAAKVTLCFDHWAGPEDLALRIQKAFGQHPWETEDSCNESMSDTSPGLHYQAMAQEIWTERCAILGEDPPIFDPIQLPPKCRMVVYGITVD